MDAELRANLAHLFDLEAAAAVGEGRVEDGYRLLQHAGRISGQHVIVREEQLAKTQPYFSIGIVRDEQMAKTQRYSPIGGA